MFQFRFIEKAIQKIHSLDGFKKLMLFLVPPLILAVVQGLINDHAAVFSNLLIACIDFFLVWALATIWTWLFISFQIHWKSTTQNRVAFLFPIAFGIAFLIITITLW